MNARGLKAFIRNSTALLSIACTHGQQCSLETTQKSLITTTVQKDQLAAANCMAQQSELVGPKENKKASLVIFDKDGTLICFHAMWVPWAFSTAQRIAELTRIDLKNDVFEVLGFCPDQQRVKPGLLASATMGQIQDALVRLLTEKGFDSQEALTVVSSAIKESEQQTQHTVKQIYDIQYLFKKLRSNNVKIALCTSDSRKGTMSTLKRLKLDKLVDIVICGDDAGAVPKPHPHNALSICRELDVDPKDTLVVGDTLSDLKMGRSANLGATVGVLSGICSHEELRPHADYVIADIGSILPIVENMDQPLVF